MYRGCRPAPRWVALLLRGMDHPAAQQDGCASAQTRQGLCSAQYHDVGEDNMYVKPTFTNRHHACSLHAAACRLPLPAALCIATYRM